MATKVSRKLAKKMAKMKKIPQNISWSLCLTLAGTSWRRESEPLRRRRSCALWESALKAQTRRMRWKLMVSFLNKTINKSLKKIIEDRLRGWDESWRWVKNHQNIIFVCRAVEGWQGQRCKARCHPSGLLKKVQEKFRFLGLRKEDKACY